jgi:hypothetical protein
MKRERERDRGRRKGKWYHEGAVDSKASLNPNRTFGYIFIFGPVPTLEN